MSTLQDTLIEIVGPIVAEENAELVEVEVKGKPGSQTVKVFVDADGGITLDHCERISRHIADRFDMLDVMPGKYRLEVSSPGIQRPLIRWDDFRRNLNREVLVSYQGENGVMTFEGRIGQVTEQYLVLIGSNEEREIYFSDLKKGQLCLPW